FGGIAANAEFKNGKYLPQLGLDLAGGTTVTLTAVTEAGKKPPEDQINQAVDIIRQRVNGLGVAEAQVSAQDDAIIVQVPGQGQRKVVEQVGQTARLYFRQVLVTGPGAPQPSPTDTASTGKPSGKPSKPGQSAKPNESPSGRAMGKALQEPRSSGRPAAAPSDQPTSLPTSLPTDLGEQQQGPDLSGVDPKKITEFQKLDCSKKENRSGGGEKLEKPDEQVVACDRTGAEKFILGPAKVLGTNVTKASAISDPQDFGKWKVTL